MKDTNKKDIIYNTLKIGTLFLNNEYASMFDYDDDNDDYFYYDVDSDSFILVTVDEDGYIMGLDYNG